MFRRLRVKHPIASKQLFVRHFTRRWNTHQHMEVVRHHTIGQHLHPTEIRHLPDHLPQDLLLAITKQALTIHRPRHAVIDRTRHLQSSNSHTPKQTYQICFVNENIMPGKKIMSRIKIRVCQPARKSQKASALDL